MQNPKFFLTVLSLILVSYLFAAAIPVQAATVWSASGSILYYMNGQVAINTTNPLSGRLGIRADKQQDYLDLQSPDGSVYRFQNPDNTRLELGVKDGTNGVTHWEVLKIIRNGDIYMGMNGDPVTLNLNGTLRTKEIIVTNQGWADYVFDNNYKLMPLSDVENYIDQKGHLPEVASAEEVATNGISLGNMQETQMQKIEELTLYAIQQDKEIKDLKSTVAELVAKQK